MSTQPAVISDANITWELPFTRPRRHVLLDFSGVRDFYHFCRGLSFLRRQESDRPNAERRAACPDFLHHLFAFEQSDDSPRRQIAEAREDRQLRTVVVFTLALGATFLAGTAREWHHLIYDEGLTIQTNLFGTTYYSLVGLHAFHVTVGLLAITTVLLFALFGYVRQEHAERVDVLALYWHFVDAVWVVVFTVVYIIGR